MYSKRELWNIRGANQGPFGLENNDRNNRLVLDGVDDMRCEDVWYISHFQKSFPETQISEFCSMNRINEEY